MLGVGERALGLHQVAGVVDLEDVLSVGRGAAVEGRDAQVDADDPLRRPGRRQLAGHLGGEGDRPPPVALSQGGRHDPSGAALEVAVELAG